MLWAVKDCPRQVGGDCGMEYGGSRGGVQPPPVSARSMAGSDTTDAAWLKHEQLKLMESRHKQQRK